MRHACYTGSRNLYPEMAASAKSLRAHSDVDVIHFLIEDPEFPEPLPPYVECIDVSGQEFFPKGGPNMRSRFSYLALMRAALCHVFPDIDEILSLDVDVLCVDDVSWLWDIDLDGCYLSACAEPEFSIKGLMYVNVGVTMYNLAMLRDGKADEVIAELNRHVYPNVEQDVFSYLCAGRIRWMPPEYNKTAYTEHCSRPRILHWAGYSHSEWSKQPEWERWRDEEWPL